MLIQSQVEPMKNVFSGSVRASGLGKDLIIHELRLGGESGAIAAGLRHSHSNTGSEPRLQHTYTVAHSNTGSLTHWMRQGIKPASLRILVRHVNCWARKGTPRTTVFVENLNYCVLFCFFVWAPGIWKFPSQGSNPHHSSNQRHSSDNTRSLIRWATRELTLQLPRSLNWGIESNIMKVKCQPRQRGWESLERAENSEFPFTE